MMEPKCGKELDYAVTRFVLGYTVERFPNPSPSQPDACHFMYKGESVPETWFPWESAAWDDCPKFSRDIELAWQVVEHFRIHPLWKEFYMNIALECDGDSLAHVLYRINPEIICRAALATVAVEEYGLREVANAKA